MFNLFTILIGASFGFDIGVMSLVISLPLQFLYFGYSIKRIFNLDWPNFLLRTLIFIGIIVVLYIIAIVITLTVMYFTGGLESMIEAQKQAIDAAKNWQ